MNETETDGQGSARILRFFVGLAVVLLPFNALPYFRDVFGEMAYEGAFYALLVGVTWWTLSLTGRSTMFLPRQRSARWLVVLVLWVFVSAVANAPEMIDAATKGRTGIEKFLLQSAVLFFAVFSTALVYNAFVQHPGLLLQVRSWILLSFIICGSYSVLEIGNLIGLSQTTYALAVVDYAIRDPDNLRAYQDLARVRSVSGEASWFAMYCALVTPWILSYLFTEAKRAWWFLGGFIYLMVLITLTWSRTAYVVTAVQLLIFLIGSSLIVPTAITRARRRLLTFGLTMIFATTVAFTASVFDETVFVDRSLLDVIASLTDIEQLSNMARFGSQVAAIKIALENPLFGIGLGQYGFQMPLYMPTWALASSDVGAWMSSSPDMPWAPAHGLYSRIAAEAGLAGLVFWLAIWLSLLRTVYMRLRRATGDSHREKMAGLALLVSLVGLLLCGFNADSFRFFGYWIALGVAWAYVDQRPAIRPHA